jgi:hypothetical protein
MLVPRVIPLGVAFAGSILVTLPASAQEGWIGGETPSPSSAPHVTAPPALAPPSPPRRRRPRTRVRSVPLLVGGSIVGAIGTAILIPSAVEIASLEKTSCQRFGCFGTNLGEAVYVGAAALGGLLFLGGGAMVGAGASPVRLDNGIDTSSRSPVVPSFTIGPRFTGLTLRF